MSRRQAVLGSSAIDLAMVLALVTLAILAMSRYVQRGLQGGLYSATSSLGQQFDPGQPWHEGQGIASNDTTRQVVRRGAVGANIQTGRLDDVYGAEPILGFPNLPTSVIYREPAAQESEVTANWTTTNNATYCTGSGC